MARKKVYEPKAVPSTIAAKVKLTIKIKDNFISVEGYEERTVPPDAVDVDMEKEWQFLYEELESTVDEEMANYIDEMQSKK